MHEQPTIYIIDDDPSVRNGLTRLINAAGLSVRSFNSAQEFLANEHEGPGCIILDVQMPGISGPELQHKLRDTQACLPIIFLSAHGDVATTVKTMKLGAVDFLTKPVDRDELFAAIEEALTKDAQRRAALTDKKSIQQRIDSLTAREYEIMTYVISGMLNKQIAATLGISEETVKIHRGRVMKKMNLVAVAELVRLCVKAGVEPASGDE